LVADTTSGINPEGTSSGTLQPGSSENPFTIRLPGKLEADINAKVTLKPSSDGIQFGNFDTEVVIRAGQSVLNLSGKDLPDPKIYSSKPFNVQLTVAFDKIWTKPIEKTIQVLPRSLDNALIRAANPIRNMLTTAYADIKWDSLPEAAAYEIKVTKGNVAETKLVLGTAYNWIGGLVDSASTKVTALTSEIQTGMQDLATNKMFEMIDKNRKGLVDIRKGSVEIFFDVLNAAGEQISSIVMKDDGVGAFWLMDDLGESKQVAAIAYDTGVVSLSEDALGKELPLAEVYYSASFVAENSIDFTKVETSAGPAASDLLQFDKYFYFVGKVGEEGPTKFFANAPLELDLAKMNDWSVPTSWLDQNGVTAVDFDFYAANARIYLNDVSNEISQPDQIVFNSDKVALYADKISLLGEFEKIDGTRTVLDVSMKESSEMALTLIGGKDGIDVRNVFLDVNGADLTMETSAGVFMDSAYVNDVGNKFEVSAASSVKMGADGGTSEVTVQAKSETANSMAVIRTGDSLELRRVVLKSFARGEIVSVSAENKGRVLLSAAIARDFHINELVNAVIVADAQGQADPLRSSSVDIVAQGADLTVEGNLPIRTAKYQGIDVHGYNVNLDASRIALSGARITAINAITAKAQTLVIDSSILRVVNAVGSINLYSGSGFVNQQYGTVAEGMVNFSGSNTFKIGDQTVSISSAQDVQNALNSGMMIQGAASPIGGKINILPANNVSSAVTSQLN
jgi:hypothetical protein